MGLDSRPRAAAGTTCVLGGCAALWMLARSADDGELGVAIVALVVSDVALALVLYAGGGALDPRHFVARLRGLLRPGGLAVVVQLGFGWAIFPWTHPDDEPDLSWFGVVPFLVVAIGVGAGLTAVLAWVLVVAPVTVLVLRTPAAVTGDHVARQAVLLSVAVLTVPAIATALSLADADDGRANLVKAVALLLGLGDEVAGRQWLLWVARVLVVTLVLVSWLLVRVRRAIRATGVDPDAGVPFDGGRSA